MKNPGSRLMVLKAVSSASPVIIPGSAMGSNSNSEMAFLPKNSLRQSAAAASVPSTNAMAVDKAAICSDNVTDSMISPRDAATLNHFNVSPFGGKLNAASSVLNA
ncbi:hypothetical protein D3C78_1429190 [compost metagenome]